MKDPYTIDPRHDQTRKILRTLGPSIALLGVVLTAVGLFSFFRSFGTFEPPRYFWCAILGLPVLGVGLMISQFAYLGSFFRYFAQETTPVARDTFNELAEGTSPGVRTMARAAAAGFSAGLTEAAHDPEGEATCPRCHTPNPPSNKYCSQCGAALGNKTCPDCGTSNEPTATFCGQCGGKVE